MEAATAAEGPPSIGANQDIPDAEQDDTLPPFVQRFGSSFNAPRVAPHLDLSQDLEHGSPSAGRVNHPFGVDDLMFFDDEEEEYPPLAPNPHLQQRSPEWDEPAEHEDDLMGFEDD